MDFKLDNLNIYTSSDATILHYMLFVYTILYIQNHSAVRDLRGLSMTFLFIINGNHLIIWEGPNSIHWTYMFTLLKSMDSTDYRVSSFIHGATLLHGLDVLNTCWHRQYLQSENKFRHLRWMLSTFGHTSFLRYISPIQLFPTYFEFKWYENVIKRLLIKR